MDPFRSILVDIDASAPAHPALERAVRLARRSGARLTIADVLTVPSTARGYLPPDLEVRMVSERREQLARVARSLAGVEAVSKLLMGRPATALIQEVLRSKHDLLVRSHARGVAAGEPKPFGAIDMELLRQCPCPVLLVRHGAVNAHPRVVGAVDASTDETHERELNARIVELTLLMADLENGTPMLLQAWSPFGERTVRRHSSDEAYAAYVEEARRHSAADLARLTRTFGERLDKIQATLRRGQPEEVIQQFVVSQGIDLVVIGTVARGGIPGWLFGNTAERILGKLPCSVLAVKPDGFESPVRIEDR